MQLKIVAFYLGLFIFACAQVYGWDDSPPCFKDLEKNFFNPVYLEQALSLNDVPQSDWTPIYQDLKRETSNIHPLIRQISDRSGYPLDHPFKPQPSAKILRRVLYDIFIRVMAYHNVTVESDLNEMFAYITEKQQGRLQACFGNASFFSDDP